MTPEAIIFLVLAYVCGSIPVGLLAGKMVKGPSFDIREHGSGNIGASNVWRTLGRKVGSVVFVVDVLKGFIPVVLAHMHGTWHHLMPVIAEWMPILTGIMAITGHNCSLFLKFKGGKGVATSLGVAIGLSPTAGCIGLLIWLALLFTTRYISVASMIAVPLCCVFIWEMNHRQFPYIPFGILVSIFAVVRHKSNIQRLQSGTESKFAFPWEKKDTR